MYNLIYLLLFYSKSYEETLLPVREEVLFDNSD